MVSFTACVPIVDSRLRQISYELERLYCTGTLLSLGFLYFGLEFVLQRSRVAARRLLAASIVYLPLLFVLTAALCNRRS